MNTSCIEILKSVGLSATTKQELIGAIIERDTLLNIILYNDLKPHIEELKKTFSSSSFTCLQKDAEKVQKWPFINLVRQMLMTYGLSLEPFRKADGYKKDGTKRFKRYFIIKDRFLTPKKKVDMKDDSENEEIKVVEFA